MRKCCAVLKSKAFCDFRDELTCIMLMMIGYPNDKFALADITFTRETNARASTVAEDCRDRNLISITSFPVLKAAPRPGKTSSALVINVIAAREAGRHSRRLWPSRESLSSQN